MQHLVRWARLMTTKLKHIVKTNEIGTLKSFLITKSKLKRKIQVQTVNSQVEVNLTS